MLSHPEYQIFFHSRQKKEANYAKMNINVMRKGQVIIAYIQMQYPMLQICSVHVIEAGRQAKSKLLFMQ